MDQILTSDAQEPSSLLLAEGLCLTHGIFPTKAPGVMAVRSAMNLPTRIRKRLTEFLNADEQTPMVWETPPSQDDLRTEIFSPLDEKRFDGWTDNMDPVLLGQYMLTITNAKTRLQELWPVFPERTFGLRNYDLSIDEFGEVWQNARLLGNIDVIFDDLGTRIIVPAQVALFSSTYPETYTMIKDIATLLLEPYVEIQGSIPPKKSMSYDKEEAIRTLLQLDVDPAIETPASEMPSGNGGGGDKKDDDTANTVIPSDHTMERRATR